MSGRLATAIVFGTSCCVLVLEILAGRLLAPIVGVSLETFTGIIGTILAGIALGNAAGGRLADEFDPAGLIGPSLILGGALAWVAPILAVLLDPVPGAGPLTIVALTTVLFLAPATVLSAVTPMVAKLQLQSLDESGTVVGNLSAAGTAGALAGTFVTGFVLVGAFGTRAVIVVIGLLLVVAGVALSVWARVRVDRFALVVVAAVGVGAVAVSERCTTETVYACVEVVADPARPSGRSINLDGLRNSYVDLNDPLYLEFRYMRLFAQAIDSTGESPESALHIGGAGFAFPSYLDARDPSMRQLVLEVDAELVEFVDAELGVRDGTAIEVVVGDARMTITTVDDDSVDLVVGDAFSGRTVPWHLTTRQFVAEVDRVLTDGGLVIVNLLDGGDLHFVRASVATYGERFEHVGLIEPDADTSRGSWNYVLVASDEPLDGLAVAAEDGAVVERGRLAELVDDALVLDDDFAPVDQIRQDR